MGVAQDQQFWELVLNGNFLHSSGETQGALCARRHDQGSVGNIHPVGLPSCGRICL